VPPGAVPYTVPGELDVQAGQVRGGFCTLQPVPRRGRSAPTAQQVGNGLWRCRNPPGSRLQAKSRSFGGLLWSRAGFPQRGSCRSCPVRTGQQHQHRMTASSPQPSHSVTRTGPVILLVAQAVLHILFTKGNRLPGSNSRATAGTASTAGQAAASGNSNLPAQANQSGMRSRCIAA